MADVIVEAEVKSNVGQLNRDLKQTQKEAISIKDAFGIASGAVAATQGAMKLLGVESEEVQKAILSVQAAMSMNQGIQSLLKQSDTIVNIVSWIGKWTGATKLLAVAQKAFNLVMAANPVMVIVAGITALIAAGVALVNIFSDSDEEVKEIDNSMEDLGHQIDKINTKASKMKILFQENKRIIDDTSKSEQERLDAQNQTTAENLKLDKERLANLEKTLKKNKTNLADSQSWNKYEKQRFAEGKENTEGVEMSTKRLNKHKKEFEKTEQAIADLQAKMHQAEYDHADKIEEILSFNTEAEEERISDLAAKRQKAYEDRVSANKDLAKQIEKIEDELTLAAIDDEHLRAEKALEIQLINAKESVKNSKASTKKKNEMLLKLDEKYLDDLNTLRDEKQAEQDEKEIQKAKDFQKILIDLMEENAQAEEDAEAETDLERALLKLERQKQAEAEQFAEHEDYLILRQELNKKYDRLEIQAAQDAVDKKKAVDKKLVDNALAVSSTLMKQASEFAGENKDMAAASAIISTYAAAAGALEEGKGTPLSYIMAASVIAAGFKSVQAIYATPVGTNTGGSAPPADTTPAPQMMSGSFDLSGATAPEPLRAFVVTDEMTNSQNQLANIRRRATI